MDVETQDPDEIPHSFFWRAWYVVDGVFRFVTGRFYHPTMQGAAEEYHATSETYARQEGVSHGQKMRADVVEQVH